MRRLLIVAIILVVAYLLSGCAKSKPGKLDGEITRLIYWNGDTYNNRVTVYSDTYGEVTVYDSPYFTSLKVGDKITIACDDLEGIFGKPSGCFVIAKEKK